MPFQIEIGRPVGAELQRAIGAQLDEARGLLVEGAADLHGAIHDARRAIRRARAALLLLRPLLGARYDEAIASCREAGRMLSPIRDAQSVIEAAQRMADGDAPLLGPEECARLRAALSRQRDRHARGAGPVLRVAARLLERSRHDLGQWTDAADEAALWTGLRFGYKRARQALRRAIDEPTDDNLHTCRQRVRAHWLQLELLRDAWRPVLGAQAGEARRLSQLLGQERDTQLLARRLERFRRPIATGVTPRDVIERLAAHGANLRARAAVIARLVFAERPRSLARRIANYAAATAGARAWNDDDATMALREGG
jgi:CHAD domain-containing protein